MAPRLRLQHLSGPQQGQTRSFAGPRVRIGRSHDNDFILPDNDEPRSSGHHAEARLENGAWWIVDLDSTNGTLLNGSRVTRQRLGRTDRIAFGEAVVSVHIPWRPHPALVASAALVLIAALWSVFALRGGTSSAPALEDVAASAAASVYVVAVEESGVRSAIGTAFAVREDGLLATNAHVASKLQWATDDPGNAAPVGFVIRGDANPEPRSIVGARPHPDWRPGSLRADVAILRVAPGPPLDPLPLAQEADLARLRRGARLSAFGFPSVLTDPYNPRGRLSTDVLGDIREGRYLSVDLDISPGTSGSPVFLENGSVAAIVAGGDFIKGPDGQSRTPSGTGANWAISVAALRQLLDTEPRP